MHKNDIDNWLKINNLQKYDALEILDSSLCVPITAQSARPAPGVDPQVDAEQAWSLATSALLDFLPKTAEMILHTSNAIPRCLTAREGTGEQGSRARPFTYDNGPGHLPFVSCDYRGSAADILDVVHEFTHALQIVVSHGDPMPPVARETCAFLGEAILIDWARRHRPTLAEHLGPAWQDAGAVYLGPDADALSRALRGASVPYDYRWNYPLARLAASALLREGTADDVATLLGSGSKAPANLARFFVGAAPGSLPPLSPPTASPVDAYRQVGAIALLDLQTGHESDQTSIGERYDRLLDCMRKQTAFIALGGSGNPVGYALWRSQPGDASAFAVDCCASPGEEETLMRALQSAVPQIAGHVRIAARDIAKGRADD